jgi:hypothetical protein
MDCNFDKSDNPLGQNRYDFKNTQTFVTKIMSIRIINRLYNIGTSVKLKLK